MEHADPAELPERPRRHVVRRRARLLAACCRRRRCYAGRGRDGASRVYLGVHYPVRHRGGRAARRRRRERRAMKVGIVGMPNAGKSSLFNALTKAGAEAANYPFTTIEPNVAVVPVRGRAARAGRARSSAPARSSGTRSPSTTSPGSSPARTRARASATSSSRTSARPTRSSTSCAPTRRRTSSTPRAASIRARDIETIETELIFADLEAAERRHGARRARGARRRQARDRRGGVAARRSIDALHAGRPARTVPVPEDAPDARAAAQPLTAKPVLFVANVDEGSDEVPAAVARARRRRRAPARSRSPRGSRPS